MEICVFVNHFVLLMPRILSFHIPTQFYVGFQMVLFVKQYDVFKTIFLLLFCKHTKFWIKNLTKSVVIIENDDFEGWDHQIRIQHVRISRSGVNGNIQGSRKLRLAAMVVWSHQIRFRHVWISFTFLWFFWNINNFV